MKSFERSHKSVDLDQVNPEHLNRETAEFSWDDLSKVPFNGNQKSNQVNSKDAVKAARDLRDMVDSLSSDRNNETERAIAVEKAKQQVLDSMRDVGSFGKGYRGSRNLPPTEQPKSETDYNQTLSDISATF